MPSCHNCGSFVSDAYERVFSRGDSGVDVCPNCEDKVRGVDGRPRTDRN